MLKVKAGKLVETMWPLVKADIPVFIHGWTGIGKTEMISGPLMERVHEEFGESVLHDYRLSSKEPVDGTGIPIVNKEALATQWTRPAFVPPDDGKMHIFYLGEIGHASVPMQHIAYQFVRERRLGEFDLPKKNRVILDLNTREDKGGDTKLVKPLENRGAHIYVDLDVPGWLKWAESKHMNPYLIAFIKARPELLHKMDPNNPAYPTPRSITEIDKLFKAKEDPRVIVSCAQALCGEGFAMQLQTFMKDMLAQLPKLKDILSDPDRCKVPSDTQHQYIVAAAVSHDIDGKNAAIYVRYLKRLAADLASNAAHDAMQRDEKLGTNKDLKSLML